MKRIWITFFVASCFFSVAVSAQEKPEQTPEPISTKSTPVPESPVVYKGADVVGDPVVPLVCDVDLRDLPKPHQWQPGDPIKEIPRLRPHPTTFQPKSAYSNPGRDPLLEVQESAEVPGTFALNGTILSFDGHGYTGLNPPDTDGAVGVDYYIQAINSGGGTAVTIHNKSDGSIAAGPFDMDTLASSGNCTDGYGDPVVLYDTLAGRWLFSEFANIGNHLCVYISQTSDPISGGWYAYDFSPPNFPDYPKYGVWPDGYYAGANENGGAVYAMDRANMLLGNAATMQRFSIPSLSGFSFQMSTPVDWDGATPPPANAPNSFLRHRDGQAHGGSDSIELYDFSVDWATPANSTLTGPLIIPVSSFDSDLCGLTSFSCIPQPGTGTTLDPLREVTMFRNQYRNFGSHQSIVGNFVTDVDDTDHAGIRWFELRNTGSGWSLYQEGTYAPDGTNRWMGSASMDGNGNLAVAYNVSSSSVFPGLRYTGREAADPLNTMPQGEFVIVDGTGSNSSNRYGDYAALTVDPVDDATFWFTGEYNTGSQWSTRIASFMFDQDPDFTLDANPKTAAVCAPDDAVFTVDVGQKTGFSDGVDLSVSGVPAGATSTFGSDPVFPGNSTSLTISNTGSAASGNYTLTIQGDSINAANPTQTVEVEFILTNGPLAAPTLSSPANASTGVAKSPTLVWNGVAGAASFDIQIATDSGFTNVVYSANQAGLSHDAASNLSNCTIYYWHVRATSSCNTGSYSSSFWFQTANINKTTYASTDVPKTIKANPAAGDVTSTLTVAGSNSISDLNVLGLVGSHTYINDIFFTLESPAGTVVQIMDRSCGNEDDFDLNLDDEAAASNWPCPPTGGGTYQPSGALSAFDGEDPNGTWILTVNDGFNGDGGSLDGWSIEITSDGGPCAATTPPEPSAMASGTPLKVISTSNNSVEVEDVGSATAYNVYMDAFGDWYSPDNSGASVCTVTTWTDNGSTITLDITVPENHWVVVSSSNSTGESSAGQDSTSGERTATGTWPSCTLGP